LNFSKISVMYEIKWSEKKDLKIIAQCHRSAFPKSLSSKMGISYLKKMIEWYISDSKKFLFHVEENGICIGYCGGMIIDGTQPMGSASGMLQYSFNEAVMAFALRPWLIFHPEFKEKYSLVKKNIKTKLGKKKITAKKDDKKNDIAKKDKFETESGLVVIGVANEYLGKGYGTTLLKEFEKKTKEMKIKKMGLAVKSDNHRAIKSYERNGWKVDKENMGYFEMVKYPD